MFEAVKRTRNLELPELSIEQKWDIVYNDEHIKWREAKSREDQARKHHESGSSSGIMPETPEWYIKKFLDKTITPKQASGLSVSLRSKELRYNSFRCVSLVVHFLTPLSAGFSTSWPFRELRFSLKH